MNSKTVVLKSVSRVTASGEADTLELKPGVNVIVGVKDTGKTGWLQTITYLLGDTDSPENAMKSGVLAKFDSATLLMTIGAEEVSVQRRWKERGSKHKVFVDNVGMSSADFGDYIQAKLDIPRVNFPKGNPYSGAAWPILSWRMLFRHMYLEELLWGDLAAKQPAKEQHACILQFLGAAHKMYSAQFGEEVSGRQELLQLLARKEQFESVLQEVARDLIPDPAISVAPTLDALDQGADRLRAEIARLRVHRQHTLDEALAGRPEQPSSIADTALAERRVQLSLQRESDWEELKKLTGRLKELESYHGSVVGELDRLARADAARDLFGPLRVTQCPVCDRKVTPSTGPECYLCGQPVTDQVDSAALGARRLAFEIEQLGGEESELKELRQRLELEAVEIADRVRRLDEELADLESQLRPSRMLSIALIPPEVSITDTKLGQAEERLAQLQRFRRAVLHRDELSAEIDRLRAEIQAISDAVSAEDGAIPFEMFSDVLSDGINEYLNHLKSGDPLRWPHGAVRFEQ